MEILKSYPAFTVVSLPQDHDIQLDDKSKDYCQTCSTEFRVGGFKRDRGEYLHAFRIGADPKHGVWAYGLGTSLTSHKQAHKVCFGIRIGQIIRIEGEDYKVLEDHNNNIKFEPHYEERVAHLQ